MKPSHAPPIDDFVNELLTDAAPPEAPQPANNLDESPAPSPDTSASVDSGAATPSPQPPPATTSAVHPGDSPGALQAESAPPSAMPIDLEHWMQPASHPSEDLLHTPLLRCVSFSLQGQVYAAEVDSLLEVLPHADIVPIPSKGYPVLGILNLRGNIVTVVDPAAQLGLAHSGDVPGRLIVVDYASEPVALRVDEVQQVVSLDEDALQSGPEHARHVRGLFESNGDMLTLLDLKALIRRVFDKA